MAHQDKDQEQQHHDEHNHEDHTHQHKGLRGLLANIFHSHSHTGP